jgi:hypothetical protein
MKNKKIEEYYIHSLFLMFVSSASSNDYCIFFFQLLMMAKHFIFFLGHREQFIAASLAI